MRLRRHWCIALIAAFLNALAPVLAYAIGQPVHELAGGAQVATQVAGAHLHHEDGHAQHAHHRATPADETPAPHCPYCLDFAAGAALAPTVPVVAAAQPGPPPLPASAPARVSARPSLRLASPRGPPSAG